MKTKIFNIFALFAAIIISMSFIKYTPSLMLKEENVTYMSEGVMLKGFVVYDANKEGVRPAVLVVHEWWGLNDYAKSRARQLAELGYIALAVDMYGAGKIAGNPKEAQELATPFYMDPMLAKKTD